jgi:hypothetical protein
MQQGKEPLRSFSDLLQFMKKTKDEPSSEPSVAPKLIDSQTAQESQPSVSVEPVSESKAMDQGDSTAPPA